MKRFVNAFTYKQPPGQIFIMASITQPNMTLSLEELLRNYTRGGEVATFTPVYQGHDDYDDNPDLTKLSAVEKLEYAHYVKTVIHDYQESQRLAASSLNATSSELASNPSDRRESSGAGRPSNAQNSAEPNSPSQSDGNAQTPKDPEGKAGDRGSGQKSN